MNKKKKIEIQKRSFLNSHKHNMAAIRLHIQQNEHDVDALLELSDCNRIIELDFSFGYYGDIPINKSRQQMLNKVRLIKSYLSTLEDHILNLTISPILKKDRLFENRK